VSEAIEKLRQDLKILEAMAAEMDEYLKGQTLFWPLSDSSLPRLTLGGYLMRQYRLLQLRDLLDPGEQARLDAAIDRFNEALVEKVVRFEQRAHEELHARLRQWSEYLRDLSKESFAAGDFYPSAVQTRAMIRALINKLNMPPYELDDRTLTEVKAYDRALRNYWRAGEFVWPPEWQPAYPKADYWWLYGQPRSSSQDS
jgi:hypothetical protein